MMCAFDISVRLHAFLPQKRRPCQNDDLEIGLSESRPSLEQRGLEQRDHVEVRRSHRLDRASRLEHCGDDDGDGGGAGVEQQASWRVKDRRVRRPSGGAAAGHRPEAHGDLW